MKQVNVLLIGDEDRRAEVKQALRGQRQVHLAGEIGDPHALAARLYAQGEWQRVHVINKRHLAAVAQAAQEHPRRDLTLDQYYHLVYHLIWDAPDGYVSVPPPPGNWQGWTYDRLRRFVAALPDPATVALAVFDGSDLRIGLVLDLRGGLIRTVTTFETFGFPAPTFDLSAAALAHLWDRLDARCREQGTPPPAAALFCSQAAFDALITSGGQPAVLADLAARGEAFWRLPALR